MVLPWLRFQAYTVGLPKTGSTSLASVFGAFRTRHEWQMLTLVDAGIARGEGRIDDEAFWAATRDRLVPPVLEMDAATSHHLYADALATRFPHARFVHVIRDARSWANSMLDMGWRMRRARARLGMGAEDWAAASLMYAGAAVTVDDGIADGGHEADAGDLALAREAALLPGLLATWHRHMRAVPAAIPHERRLTIRLEELSDSWPAIAAFVGADQELLRPERDRERRAPARFDRFLVDPVATLAAYERTAAPTMALTFPDEHERLIADLRGGASAGDWPAYRAAVDAWVDEQLRTVGPGIAH